jgi:hypothetical protein
MYTHTTPVHRAPELGLGMCIRKKRIHGGRREWYWRLVRRGEERVLLGDEEGLGWGVML